jgi:hypothetical protein
LPAFTPSHTPPSIPALLIAPLAEDYNVGPRGLPEDVVNVTVATNGCTNPVLIVGDYYISTNTWFRLQAADFYALPAKIAITLYGAQVRKAVVGLIDSVTGHLVTTTGRLQRARWTCRGGA